MWAILGAPAVPVSVHLFARVHVATLRMMRLGEFDFRFRSVQARGPSTLQSGVLYEVGRVTGQGTPAAPGQQLDELCRGTRSPEPWSPRARAQVAGSRTLPSSTGSKDPHRQRTLPRLLAHLRFISQNESAGLYLRLSGAFDTDKGVKPGPPGSGVVNRRTSLFSPHFKARREIPDGLEFWGYITEYRLCCLLI